MEDRIARNLRKLREKKGLSQERVAKALGITQAAVSALERTSSRLTLKRALELARLFDHPLQSLVSGNVHAGEGQDDIALELAYYGLADLVVDSPRVPGAFRSFEEVLALAVVGEPSTRVLSALPALVTFNRCRAGLLIAHAESHGVERRVGWIVDPAATLVERGLKHSAARPDLPAIRTQISRLVASPRECDWDSIGRPTADRTKLSIVHQRWRVSYDESLEGFGLRAHALLGMQP
ncbi:MAG: helix-turn-helix transcriptional regulator [Acidobacteriota bacterium]